MTRRNYFKINQVLQERLQEDKDARQLSIWREAIKNNNGGCPTEVKEYLDKHLEGWFEADDDQTN